MRCVKINLSETGEFSDLFLKYIEQDPALNAFINLPPVLSSFPEIIKNRKFENPRRKILQRIVKGQYAHLKMPREVDLNIRKITDSTTFTITTGHQLNIFTGPLYFIYKILTVINTCEILNKEYPEYHFVPVYWMASEDHDFEEIRSFTLFGKKYTWETDQEGPVGRMDPSSIQKVLELLPEKAEIFEFAYLNHNSLAEAVRYYVNELFGNYGLVVIDADDAELKMQIRDIMKDDLVNHHANDEVEATSSILADKGYKTQVYPRAINLFYMKDHMRKRLTKEGGYYAAVDSDIRFTQKEILIEVEKKPQHFSPNVILRPIYQEIILPNIAYIGGPAEIAYWLQLKGMFDHFKVTFPILMPRNFNLIINKGLNKRLQKLRLSPRDVFKSLKELKDNYLEEHADFTLSIESEEKILHELFESIQNKSRAVDRSLEGFVESEKIKVLKILENISKRLKRSEEQKQSVELSQIENLKEKLFPGGNLQERIDNFLNFALNDPDFIDNIKKLMNPFDFRFNIIIED